MTCILYLELENNIKKDPFLLQKYKDAIENHNDCVRNNLYPDSGFDIFLPKMEKQKYEFDDNETKLIPLGIKCCVYKKSNFNGKIPIYKLLQTFFNKGLAGNIKPQPFKIHPRSSIWKTGFCLANSTGIIDSGYRGTIYAPIHNVRNNCSNKLIYGHRYLQICMPDLQPFLVQIVGEVKNDSIRGTGGLGSTGN